MDVKNADGRGIKNMTVDFLSAIKRSSQHLFFICVNPVDLWLNIQINGKDCTGVKGEIGKADR